MVAALRARARLELAARSLELPAVEIQDRGRLERRPNLGDVESTDVTSPDALLADAEKGEAAESDDGDADEGRDSDDQDNGDEDDDQ